MQNSLLLIEDEALLGNELVRFFVSQNWDVALATSLAEARDLLKQQHLEPLVVLSDMNLPDGNALDFLAEVKPLLGAVEWILLTGYGGVADSVRALRLGAYDFIEKPCDLDRLAMVVAGAARSAQAQRRLRQAHHQQAQHYTPEAILGTSAAMATLRALVKQLSQVRWSSIIITGETGTGKGLVARVLHYAGARSQGPLVELNCAAIPRDLLEAQLFGYEAGAFTGAKKRHHGLFEQAHQGTLFLDEIGEMNLDLQGKLLKAIEDLQFRRLGGEQPIKVDVQIIAATNQDLAARVRDGQFRSDLYHRLNVIQLHIPPLRERLEDLRVLVPHSIALCNARTGKNVRHIPKTAWDKLERYTWPGNIRELTNVIERCVLLADSEELPVQWLQLSHTTQTGLAPAENGVFVPLDGSLSLHDIEKFVLQAALERTDYNVTAAARLLKTTRETLRYRVQKYHLRYERD